MRSQCQTSVEEIYIQIKVCRIISIGYGMINSHQHINEVLNRKRKKFQIFFSKKNNLSEKVKNCHFWLIFYIVFDLCAQQRAHIHESVHIIQNCVTYIFIYLTHILSTS